MGEYRGGSSPPGCWCSSRRWHDCLMSAPDTDRQTNRHSIVSSKGNREIYSVPGASINLWWGTDPKQTFYIKQSILHRTAVVSGPCLVTYKPRGHGHDSRPARSSMVILAVVCNRHKINANNRSYEEKTRNAGMMEASGVTQSQKRCLGIKCKNTGTKQNKTEDVFLNNNKLMKKQSKAMDWGSDKY